MVANEQNGLTNLLMVQFFPLNPAAQEQVKSLIPSMQLPPFAHGFGTQSSISEEGSQDQSNKYPFEFLFVELVRGKEEISFFTSVRGMG